jgi:hypothetical protein
MLNPILGEVAREQCKDRFREAEQYRLANAVMARQPAERFDLRTSLGNLVIAVRYLLKAPARAD